MIFRRKKTVSPEGVNQAVLRGRDNAGRNPNSGAENPLAHRLHPQDEPDTIDLEQPPSFGTAEVGAEPDTRDLRGDSEKPSIGTGILSFVPATGKYYVQPPPGGEPAYLNGEVIDAPTELRHEDCIRMGDAEFQFRLRKPSP